MRRHVLSGLYLAEQLTCVTADAVVVNLAKLDDAFRIDDEGAAQREAFFLDQHAEVARDDLCRVPEHRVLDFLDRLRSVMPCLVREMGVGGHAVHFHAKLLELRIHISDVTQLGWAYECEVRRIEEEYGPLALDVCIGYRNELPVVVRSRLERLDCSIDQTHLAGSPRN
jgi:hypothetical protein